MTEKKWGGARPGAGRKPKKKPEALAPSVKVALEPQAHGGALLRQAAEPVPQEEQDMLTFLQNVALGRTEASNVQVRAAIAAVQYTNRKMGDSGKKEERQEKARKAVGRFTPAAPPKLAAVGGKKV